MLPFDADEAVRTLSKADKRLAAVIKRAGPFTLRPEKMQSPFQALARAIIYQQLSGKAAATIHGRVVALFPGGKGLRPELLADMGDERLRGAGMSFAKIAGLKDLAVKTLDGTVPTLARLKRMNDAEIIERLVSVRGIGQWTVEMLLMFRLGRPDVLPVGDLGVRAGFQYTYGTAELPHAKEILAHGERWRPYRSVASWYMWRAVELKRKEAEKAASKTPPSKPRRSKRP